MPGTSAPLKMCNFGVLSQRTFKALTFKLLTF